MKWSALALAVMGTSMILAGCDQTPVPNVAVPRPDDMSAYRAAPAPKPMPPNGSMVQVPGTAQPATQP